jgi:hypothetical protein
MSSREREPLGEVSPRLSRAPPYRASEGRCDSPMTLRRGVNHVESAPTPSVKDFGREKGVGRLRRGSVLSLRAQRVGTLSDTILPPRDVVVSMRIETDPDLLWLFGSEARILSLAVLANAGRPLTGYRVAQLAGLPRIKVYEQLQRAERANWILRVADGYRMPEGELRTLLRQRIRVAWSSDLAASVDSRARQERAILNRRGSTSWFDLTKYTPNPTVRAQYAKEFERPSGKGEFPGMDSARRSRKLR